jgi:hypothetical protein
MNLHLLNVTSMSARRKDGHPSVYYLGSSIGPPSLHRQDCSHWYLPGVPDSWNELLYTLLLKWESVHAQNLTESSQATPWLHRKLSVLTNVIKERQFIDQRLLFPQTNQQNHHLLSWLWCVRFQVSTWSITVSIDNLWENLSYTVFWWILFPEWLGTLHRHREEIHKGMLFLLLYKVHSLGQKNHRKILITPLVHCLCKAKTGNLTVRFLLLCLIYIPLGAGLFSFSHC